MPASVAATTRNAQEPDPRASPSAPSVEGISVKVLVTDPLSEDGLAVLREAGFQVAIELGRSPEQLKELVGDCDAWLVRSGTQVTAQLIEAANELKVIGRAGVGVDNIDIEAATARGIVVMNTPFGNTLSVAEHTIALMLAMARNIPTGTASLRSGQWLRKELKGVEVNTKTLGIIGLGRIGKEVASRAQGLGMHTVAYDPFISAEVASGLDIELLDLDELYPRADFITVHVPLTPKTKGLIGTESIALMKPGVRLINVARGGVIDETALLAGIENGTVAGAALDVFMTEPPTDSPLLARPEVIGTPHLGASTQEASVRVGVQVAQQVVAYLMKGTADNAVNLAASPDPLTAPFLSIAEAVGSWALQLGSGQPRGIKLEALGEASKAQTPLLTDAALKGLLEVAHGGGRVTLVNARMVAEEGGLKVEEASSPNSPDFPALVRVTVTTDEGSVTVSGTSFGALGPRIVSVDEYEVEVKPLGRFLVLHHQDTPGTISRVAGTLGDHDINIGQMVVGRLAPRGKAISILRVDDLVPDIVVEALAASKRFDRVHRVEV